MLSFFSVSRTRGFVKRTKITGLILLVLLFVLGSCSGGNDIDDTNYPGSLPVTLEGVWSFDGTDADRYTISSVAIQHEMVFGGFDYGFAGTIHFVSNYSNNSGVIIFKDSADNKFKAVYYRDLTVGTVRLGDAYTGFSMAETSTLEEAIAKFTQGQWGNYVDWGVVQPQSKE